MCNTILFLLVGDIFSKMCNEENVVNIKKNKQIKKKYKPIVKKIQQVVNNTSIIKIKSGTNATLTYFTDTVFQCISGIPNYNSMAVNPLLLGFTLKEWNDKYSNANANLIPWCGKKMEIIVNNKRFVGTIIDTCDPGGNGAFIDPNTGLIIGGKCDYTNVIDLYGDKGLEFLKNTVGDDFYQGKLTWRLLDDI